MAITQKSDGRWCVYYRDSESGRQIWKYFGRGIEAEKNAREYNAALDLRSYEQRTPRQQSPLFFELVNEYIKAKFGLIEKSTKDNFLTKMRGVIGPAIGHLPAIKLTPRRIDKYVTKRLTTQKRIPIRYGVGKKLVKFKPAVDSEGKALYIKRTTVNREISDIQAVLNWSVAEGYLTHNPLSGYRKPKRDDEIIAPPTIDEIRRLFAQAPEHLVRALMLSYYSGIRPGAVELLSICWNDIDFEGQLIFIRSARKNGIKSRRVPIHKKFADRLQSWYEADRKINAEHVVHFRGRKVKRISKSFATAKRKAKIMRRLTPYSFRHAFATYLLENTADLKTTSEMLGHTRTDTTTRIYQHSNLPMRRKTIERLPALDLENDV